MIWAFWGLFLAYHAAAVIGNRRADDVHPGTRYSAYLQAPLFAVAAVIAAQTGALGRNLVMPEYVVLGLALGYAVHAFSLLLTNGFLDLNALLRGLVEYFSDWKGRGRYFAESPSIMLMLAVNSVTEEIIYRAVAQPLLTQLTGQPWVAIGVVAVVFSLAHRHFLRGPLLEGVEFLAYAVLLGALYYAAGSLMLVIVVHTVRNFELYYQQFLIHAEKLGSEEAAYAAQEKGGLPGRIPAKS